MGNPILQQGKIFKAERKAEPLHHKHRLRRSFKWISVERSTVFTPGSKVAMNRDTFSVMSGRQVIGGFGCPFFSTNMIKTISSCALSARQKPQGAQAVEHKSVVC
jgi:hypothetical protein